jgi:cell division protease FtsH
MKDYEWAKDKIIMGPERRSSYIPHDSKKLTAYHEVSELSRSLSLALY